MDVNGKQLHQWVFLLEQPVLWELQRDQGRLEAPLFKLLGS